jgi:hypothetical protein
MLTCKSPRKVMRAAYHLASQSLPDYSHKFSRHDFTLPQLFACLVVKEHLKRSYRGAEELLRDSDAWLRDCGMTRAPDHNTLCRAANFLLRQCRVDRLLDRVAAWAATARVLGLSVDPLAVDSTHFESRHVSRHYERRCASTRRWMRDKEKARRGRKSSRADTVRRLPKLGVAVASGCHLALSVWTGTGMGADQPLFEPLVFDAWRRVPHRRFTVVADAGLDSNKNHELARRDMGLRSLMPPEHGRPPKGGAPPGGRWRRHCKRVLSTKAGRKKSKYTRRWQVETFNSMVKRNLGSALAGRTAWSRKRDMALKVLTHDIMVL